MLDALPLNTNGQVDRRALPAPSAENLKREGLYVKPRDRWKLELAAIWERILDSRSIGVTANFFELSGNSLLAARLVGEIEKL